MRITAVRNYDGDISLWKGEVKITKTNRTHFLGDLKEPTKILRNPHERYLLISQLKNSQLKQLMDNWPVFCDVPDDFLNPPFKCGTPELEASLEETTADDYVGRPR